EVALLLFFSAEGDDCGANKAESQDVGHRRRPGQRPFLPEDDLRHQACAAPAKFPGPGNSGPATLVKFSLPGSQIFETHIERIFPSLVPVLRNVGSEPAAQILAK